MKKGKIAQDEQFNFFPQCFLCNLCLKNPSIAIFQLLSAASLNLGQLNGNGLKEPCSVKRGLTVSAISIDQGQPAQADLGQNFSL